MTRRSSGRNTGAQAWPVTSANEVRWQHMETKVEGASQSRAKMRGCCLQGESFAEGRARPQGEFSTTGLASTELWWQ